MNAPRLLSVMKDVVEEAEDVSGFQRNCFNRDAAQSEAARFFHEA